MVDRYGIGLDGNSIKQPECGPFVYYSDYEALEADRDRWEKRAKFFSERDCNARIELCYNDGVDPFARETLKIIDVGVADNVYVVESRTIEALEAMLDAEIRNYEHWKGAYDSEFAYSKILEKDILQLKAKLAALNEEMVEHAGMMLCEKHADYWGEFNTCPCCRADKAEAEVARLRKALTWMPISEAPEEGAWVLVNADGAVNCAFVKRGCLPEDWTDPQAPNISPQLVTHWMPIPALEASDG